jgi:hypothetical protein
VRAAAVVIASLLCAGVARADCPSMPGAGAELARVDDTERLRFVRGVLAREKRSADAWTWGWAGAGVAFTAAGVAAALATSDEGARTESLYGAGTSALLPIFVFLLPMRARSSSWEDDAGGTCAALARAEARLALVADDDELRSGLLAHGTSVVTSVLLALPLGLVWNRWRGMALNAASSELVGIAQIGTTPTAAVHALRRYRGGLLSDEPGPRWTITALPGAFGITVGLAR